MNMHMLTPSLVPRTIFAGEEKRPGTICLEHVPGSPKSGESDVTVNCFFCHNPLLYVRVCQLGDRRYKTYCSCFLLALVVGESLIAFHNSLFEDLQFYTLYSMPA